jgi:hypothetical protein
MSESIDYTAEGEAFGASYADGLALGLHGSELPEHPGARVHVPPVQGQL